MLWPIYYWTNWPISNNYFGLFMAMIGQNDDAMLGSWCHFWCPSAQAKLVETTRMVDATIVSGRECEWSESKTQRQNFRAPPCNNCEPLQPYVRCSTHFLSWHDISTRLHILLGYCILIHTHIVCPTENLLLINTYQYPNICYRPWKQTDEPHLTGTYAPRTSWHTGRSTSTTLSTAGSCWSPRLRVASRKGGPGVMRHNVGKTMP
jgi:hypothetical protein